MKSFNKIIYWYAVIALTVPNVALLFHRAPQHMGSPCQHRAALWCLHGSDEHLSQAGQDGVVALPHHLLCGFPDRVALSLRQGRHSRGYVPQPRNHQSSARPWSCSTTSFPAWRVSSSSICPCSSRAWCPYGARRHPCCPLPLRKRYALWASALAIVDASLLPRPVSPVPPTTHSSTTITPHNIACSTTSTPSTCSITSTLP